MLAGAEAGGFSVDFSDQNARTQFLHERQERIALSDLHRNMHRYKRLYALAPCRKTDLSESVRLIRKGGTDQYHRDFLCEGAGACHGPFD